MTGSGVAVWAVEAVGLGKEYAAGWGGGRRLAVADVSFRLERGRVLGLLGPNGSGKSTTLKALAGLVRPTAGVCRIGGHAAGSDAARARVAYLPESLRLPPHLTPREWLGFCAALHGRPGPGGERLREELLGWAGLAQAADRRLATLSKGMRQRLGLAQVALPGPAVALLDEPASGLDPDGRRLLGSLVRDLAAGGTAVVLTSHLAEAAECWCDEVVILEKGRVLAAGSPRDLAGREARQSAAPVGLERVFLEKTSGLIPPGPIPAGLAARREPRGRAAAARLRLLAAQTMLEAARARLTLWLAAVGAGLLAGAAWLREFHFGVAELGFIADFGLGAIGLTAVAAAVPVSVNLFFRQIEHGGAACLLAGPVRRWEFVAGKWLGLAGLLGVLVAALGVLLALLLAWRARALGVSGGAPAVAEACLRIALKATLVSALTLLVCTYARTALFAGGAAVLLVLAGQLRPLAGDGAWSLAWRCCPNLGLFDAEPSGAAAIWPLLAGYWGACLILCGAVAGAAWERREL
ncbi:MAG: ABC transporter ATP-binding protein [Opitutaceae bacterium]|nr:ABC transporter ATP-binding protein [Opitutaceae bacterium]